jgi:hypothetical protein
MRFRPWLRSEKSPTSKCAYFLGRGAIGISALRLYRRPAERDLAREESTNSASVSRACAMSSSQMKVCFGRAIDFELREFFRRTFASR